MALSPDDYIDQFTSPLPALHEEVLQFTLKHHPHAHMVSGHVQGQLLRFISRMLRPRRVLEIGTFTGFSGLCLADGLTADGELYTLELREEDAQTARSFFQRSQWQHRIHCITGPAAEIIPMLSESWDLVFIDADKPGYIDYFELVVPRLSASGVILADNVFFHGGVFEEMPKGRNAKAMAEFNAHVRADPRVEAVMIPLRDGITLIRRR